MHHTLRIYGRYQHSFLRAYISLAKLTRIPLLGSLVRAVANLYGMKAHGGYLLTTDEALEIIDCTQGEISLGPCSCRQVYHNCKSPIMNEVIIGDGYKIFEHREFKPVSKEEAKHVIREAHRNRLTHNLMRCSHHLYAICSCCSCCCVPTRLRQKYGIGQALIRKPNIVEAVANHGV